MYAIETRYMPATNTRGSRIVATCADMRRKSWSYPHEAIDPHKHVAELAAAEWFPWAFRFDAPRGRFETAPLGKGRYVTMWIAL